MEDIEISLKEAKRMLQNQPNDFIVVDVRTPEEWRSASAPFQNVLHIELNTLPHALSLIEKEKEVFLLCKSGARSLIATQFLRMSGYRAKNIHGGISG